MMTNLNEKTYKNFPEIFPKIYYKKKALEYQEKCYIKKQFNLKSKIMSTNEFLKLKNIFSQKKY
jgi:hypothetical protein